MRSILKLHLYLISKDIKSYIKGSPNRSSQKSLQGKRCQIRSIFIKVFHLSIK